MHFSGAKEIWYGANGQWDVAIKVDTTGCNNTVFVDPIVGTVKACYYRDVSIDSSNLNTDGFFYARVQVCNTTSGALQDVRDYGLCRQYPHGNYKPTGVIQNTAIKCALRLLVI